MESSPFTTDAPALPATMRALVLAGRGFDELEIRTVPTPRPRPDQLVARVDAAGICTSLIKLIEQGGDHRLLYGWDPEEHPLILGDEGSVTVAAVGEALAGGYRVGERFVVQPAVDHPPVNHRERYRDGGRGVHKVGVGYTLPGHLAEYLLIPEEVLAAGCLVPVPDPPPAYAHAAMAEPFSCVVSGQDHHLHLAQETPTSPRTALKGLRPGGVTLVVGAGAMGRMHVDLALAAGPRALLVSDVVDERLARVRALFAARAEAAGVRLETVNPGERDLEALLGELTGWRGADDIVVAVGAPGAVEGVQRLAARGAVLNLFGGFRSGDETVRFDGNTIHYQETVVTGSSGGSPWDVARTLELMARGEVDMAGHITRVGDLAHAPALLGMVARRELDGKAVVYPHRPSREVLAVEAWRAEDERAYLAGA